MESAPTLPGPAVHGWCKGPDKEPCVGLAFSAPPEEHWDRSVFKTFFLFVCFFFGVRSGSHSDQIIIPYIFTVCTVFSNNKLINSSYSYTHVLTKSLINTHINVINRFYNRTRSYQGGIVSGTGNVIFIFFFSLYMVTEDLRALLMN